MLQLLLLSLFLPLAWDGGTCQRAGEDLVVYVLRAIPVDSICERRCSVVLVHPMVRDSLYANPRGHVVDTIGVAALQPLPHRAPLRVQAFDVLEIGRDTAGFKVSLRRFGTDSARVFVQMFGVTTAGRQSFGVAQGVARREAGAIRLRYVGVLVP